MQRSTRVVLSFLVAVVAAAGGWVGTHVSTQMQDWQFFGLSTVVTALYVTLVWARPTPTLLAEPVDQEEPDAPRRRPSPRPARQTSTTGS